MPFNFLTRQQVVDRAKTDVQRSLPESNPFLRNSFIGSLITGFAGRVYEFYIQLKVLTLQMFPDTATGEFLERWCTYKGLSRNPATPASGNVTFTGTPGSSIPIGTSVSASDGQEYTTQAALVLSNNVVGITSLTRSGTTATATTASDHNLASGMSVAIAGAVETEYNGTVEITVISATQFTYEVLGSPSTPATGTITVEHDSGSVAVESVDEGANKNQDSGAELTLGSPIAGVDNTALVQFGGVSGGVDLESDNDLRARVIERYADPVSTFSASAIEKKAEEVPGVTRVWVEKITPAIGQVTIYFTRDNDVSIIPDAGEVTAVKNKLLEILPAHVSESDMIVAAPTAVPVDFTFTALSPNTSDMHDAINASLAALMADDTAVGSDLTAPQYISAIQDTLDASGNPVLSFTLSAPAGDVAIAAGELPTLGTVTFP